MSDPELQPRFFATAARGTEGALADELGQIGIVPVSAARGGVAFGESLADAYRACLWSRIASRVLLPIARFDAVDAEALYDAVRALSWTEHLGPERTMSVSVTGAVSPLGPSHFLALKTKDAIVDQVRDSEGSRPSIDKRAPDVHVVVHVDGTSVTVSIDLAGMGFHRRGHGRSGAIAPLRESLAAAIVRLSGWTALDPSTPLFDPMCGSGTLLLEAAAMARDIAPGLQRGRIGAEGWRGHEHALWKQWVEDAEERRRVASDRELRIYGADDSSSALRVARELVAAAGFDGAIKLERGHLNDARPPTTDAGIVITNPPYGERLGEAGDLGPLYELLGDVFKRRFAGWSTWVLTGNRALEKRIGLRPASRTILFNGPIECRLLEIPIAAARVESAEGPGWRRRSDEARGLARKLEKNVTQLRRWAEREGMTCYRVYDADMAVYNLSIDWYDGAVRVEEYYRPRKIDSDNAERRLAEAVRVAAEVLGVAPHEVTLRVRRRLGRSEQPERHDDESSWRDVRERDLTFRVNLGDHLDTGLFLDDRELRARIRESAGDKDFLNLFAYTSTASVAAAAGGARTTTSVDLSNTYLDWGRDNLRLNNLDSREHRRVRADAMRFLSEGTGGRRWDLAFVAPPTRSRSKGMRGDFEVQRDHVELLSSVAAVMRDGGVILFTSNFREFALDAESLAALEPREITREVTPIDFRDHPRLRAWQLQVGRRGQR